jgi:hypothetical protein
MTTTTTTKTNFQIHAIPQEVFDRVRASGVDVSGNPVERLTATGSEPLRCCLRDAEAGEQVILFGHDGSDPETVISDMLAETEVVQIHSRNVAYGCYMFTVTHPGSAAS